MKASALLLAAYGIASTSAASTPATVHIAQQLGPAFDKNGDAAGVSYWKAGAIVDGHNDLSLRLPASASVPAMYNSCLAFCKAHKCHSFDMVLYKQVCFFDIKSCGDVLFHRDPARPNQPYEKEDTMGVAYIKMKPNTATPCSTPTNPKPQPSTVSKAPLPTVQSTYTVPAVAQGTPCFGFGLKPATAEVFLADTLPSSAAVQNELTKQCGDASHCLKYVTCAPATPCGSIAIRPDTKLLGMTAKPSVVFGKTRGEVKAKALAACQTMLDNEGMDGECQELADFCFPMH